MNPQNDTSLVRRLGDALLLGLTCTLACVSNASWADATTVQVQTVKAQRAVLAQPVPAYGVVSASGASVQSMTLPFAVHVTTLRVTPGQRVAKGTPLMDVVADAAATLARDQSITALKAARRDLAHTQSLYDAHLATQSQLDAAHKALDDATQAQAVQERMGGAADGSQTLRAPFDGVVVQLSAGPGDQIAPGAPLALLARNTAAGNAPNVMLYVEPALATTIRAGDSVEVRSLAANNGDATITGRVVTVGAAVDPTTQAVVVSAVVPAAPFLLPGARVAATVQSTPGLHWVVPRGAVLNDAKGACLYQVDAQHRAHRVPVITRIDAGQRYGVDGPLRQDQPVVTSGTYELADGMAVVVQGASR